MKRLTILFCTLLFGLNVWASSPAAEGVGADTGKDRPVKVEMKTTEGTMVLELDPARAPKTVENFLHYVRDGQYKGTVFHRVIPGFMIQGGGYDADFREKPTRSPIQNEADNGLRNDKWTIAMARTGDPHSASAQFFINVNDNAFLNHSGRNPRGWGYAVFGKVVEGGEVADRISRLATSAGGPFPKDVPQKPVRIEDVKIIGGDAGN